MENWKIRLHEVSMRRCASITKSLCWIRIEVCNPSMYDGLMNLDYFIFEFEILSTETLFINLILINFD